MSKKKKIDRELFKLQQQEILSLRRSEIDPMAYNDNQHTSLKNMSRRDLLGQGFIAGSGILMMPSFFSALYSKSSFAQSAACKTAGFNSKIPFMSIDLSGGAAISGGNVMVGGPGGQMDMLGDNGYKRLGFAPNTQANVSNELGILFHADSAFLRGIKSKASAQALQRVNGAVACTRLANDTQNNTQSPLAGIIMAGGEGALFPSIGTRDSNSGARSMPEPSMFQASLRPVRVADDRALKGSVDTGKLVSELGSSSANSIMRRIANLSEAKKRKLTDEMVKQNILNCSYQGAAATVKNFADPNAVNVRADGSLVGANGIFTEAELRNGKFNRAATHAKAIINGYAGASVMEFGGYDYHNGTRATGEMRDFEAGVAMGAAIEYAHRRKTKLMLYVFSDGSVRSDGELDMSPNGRGKGVWRGDSGTTSAALILVYNPNGRPQMTSTGHQLGHYLPDGNVNRMANVVADSASNLAYWVVLNYMALNGEVGQFARLFPNNPFGSSATALDSYIHFAAA